VILLDGQSLTIEHVCAVAEGRGQPEIAPDSLAAMAASRSVVERLAEERALYGVNTGVGALAGVRIPPGDLEQMQRNVIRSHAAGVGEPMSVEEVRAMMLIRANVLARGLSGIRPVVAQRLCAMLARGVVPVVPSRGSVGASGDLAPLAHVALVLIGEGEALFEGRRMEGGEALRRADLEPLRLEAKEAVSLINGTQAMLAVGCLELASAEILVQTADTICALTLDALRGTPRAFDPRLHAARGHPGQIESAARMLALLEESEIRQSHLACARVQDAYSLRCAPQVHGAVRDCLAQVRRVFAIELNAATDNPLVFGGDLISGGNFHGAPLALQLDAMAVALTLLSGISERRADRLVHPAFNEDLPAFLAGRPGLESGLMMAQVTAAALVGENRVLANPASTGSIPTSGNQEDFVPMGMTCALKLKQVVRNTRLVLAVEALAAARALDFLLPLRTSPALEAVKSRIRDAVPASTGDRVPGRDIEAIGARIAAGDLSP
jgi:histidine ammonia-lyase